MVKLAKGFLLLLFLLLLSGCWQDEPPEEAADVLPPLEVEEPP